MEIIKRANTVMRWKVVKGFMRLGRRVEPGEEIEIKDDPEALGYVQRRLIVPCDLPAVGVYIALRPFFLPGQTEKFECKAMDLVSLKAEDALQLMLEGAVIPKDNHRWRPMNRRLRKGPDQSAREHEALARAEFEQKLYQTGIHPAQKRK